MAPDPQHPFGRGMELYFWSFLVAVFLFVGGAVVAFMEGLERVRHPHDAESGLVFSLIVLAVAAAFELFIAYIPALREFNRFRGGRSVVETVREAKDPALLVVVFEDTAAMLGLAVAAGGLILTQVTGDARWDGIASIAIAVILAAVAFIIAFEVKAMLVGEAAGRDERSKIRAAILAVPEVQSIGRLLTMQLAPHEILVNADVAFEDGVDVEAITDVIEDGIRTAVPEATRIFVEAERP